VEGTLADSHSPHGRASARTSTGTRGWPCDRPQRRVEPVGRRASARGGGLPRLDGRGNRGRPARFESEAAAHRNNDWPEQDQWWAETAQLLDGEATLRNSVNVMPDLHGAPDEARFVQIMQGAHSSELWFINS